MSEFDNVTAPPPPTTGEAPQDQRTMSLLAHLLGIVTGPIGALIIWLVSKDDASKGFVVDQSKEALNFQITVFIAIVISWILAFVLIGLLLCRWSASPTWCCASSPASRPTTARPTVIRSPCA